MTYKPYPHHPIADAFKMMDQDDLDAMADDMRKHGYDGEPIMLLEEMVLDGRNRQRAAVAAGVAPPTSKFSGDDPVAFVTRRNLTRRHMTDTEKGVAAAKLCNVRQSYTKTSRPGSMEPAKPISLQDAADLLGTSRTNTKRAKVVLDNAVPEIVEMMEQEDVSIRCAYEIAHMPKDEQREIAANGVGAVKEASRAARSDRETQQPKQKEDAAGRSEDDSEGDQEIGHRSRGKGVTVAHQAINLLHSIPKNDALRKRGFQIVLEWVQRNLRKMG